jgi:23S rRNA pseudouridine955/2504/2580 synthase
MIFGSREGPVKRPGTRIEILFENDDCLILNKPAGLAVQGGAGVGRSLDAMLAETRNPRPLLVHRLDKETSGVILTAKNREAAARFSALFARREGRGVPAGLRKIYLAVCAGRPRPETGVIRTDLELREGAKKAETAYRRISGGPLPGADGGGAEPRFQAEFSVLELELATGRLHQIRRHLASIGCPILGDDKYGDFSLNKKLRKSRGLKRLLLHASRLVIGAELPGCPLDITAPLPEYFADWVGEA